MSLPVEPPTQEECRALGPSALAFLRTISQPHRHDTDTHLVSNALDATINGAMGGMMAGGAIGAAFMPVYSFLSRNRDWPRAGVVPYRMAQYGFLLGGCSFLGLSLLQRIRDKHDAKSSLIAGGVAGVLSWSFAARSSVSSPAVKLARVVPSTVLPAAPGTVLCAMSGAVMSSLMWGALQSSETDTVQSDTSEVYAELRDVWVSGAEDPWSLQAATGRARGALNSVPSMRPAMYASPRE